MRVVAGSARGRALVAPAGREVRPTADRVREALFNALGSLGLVEDATLLDLFAGSGALGIEALSRGAARVVFVEQDPRARAAIADNLATTGLVARAAVVAGTAEGYLRAAPPRFDVVLLDPPYAYGDWPALLEAVHAGWLVIETDRELTLGPRWEVVRSKWYGTTLVLIARSAGPSQVGPPGDPSTNEPDSQLPE